MRNASYSARGVLHAHRGAQGEAWRGKRNKSRADRRRVGRSELPAALRLPRRAEASGAPSLGSSLQPSQPRSARSETPASGTPRMRPGVREGGRPRASLEPEVKAASRLRPCCCRHTRSQCLGKLGPGSHPPPSAPPAARPAARDPDTPGRAGAVAAGS